MQQFMTSQLQELARLMRLEKHHCYIKYLETRKLSKPVKPMRPYDCEAKDFYTRGGKAYGGIPEEERAVYCISCKNKATYWISDQYSKFGVCRNCAITIGYAAGLDMAALLKRWSKKGKRGKGKDPARAIEVALLALPKERRLEILAVLKERL